MNSSNTTFMFTLPDYNLVTRLKGLMLPAIYSFQNIFTVSWVERLEEEIIQHTSTISFRHINITQGPT